MPPPSLHLYLLFFLHIFATITITTASIQDLLHNHGLPGGLFPETVASYILNQTTGLLEVYLDKPCLTKFETRFYFDRVVRANLTFGGLLGLEGIVQQELFLWLPVKDIIVYDPFSGLILFDIGLAHKQLSLSLFEDPPHCRPQGTYGMIPTHWMFCWQDHWVNENNDTEFSSNWVPNFLALYSYILTTDLIWELNIKT